MFHGVLLALAVTSVGNGATRSADGITYPGKSVEAARYNSRWDAHMKRVAKLSGTADAQLRQIQWMVGSWTAQPREFSAAMIDPATAERYPASPARIGWTPGKRWLRINFVAEPWHAEWNYYLGYDPVGHR